MIDYPWPGHFWPHQTYGCSETVRAVGEGKKRIVLTSPTGGGKTSMMTALIERAESNWEQSILYTNRRLLLAQTDAVLTKDGIEHGMRAAGYKPALLRSCQLAMTQSEFSAVYKMQRRSLHPAQLVEIDEVHCQNGEMMQQFVKDHHASGAAVVAFTATPLDLEGEWDELIVAGTNSELRACGALVPAYTYCPDEPDMKHIKNYRIGEDLTDKQNSKVMMRPGVFGRVCKHWERLNPDHKPTILFGPDVAGSLFFAEEFHKIGVRSAHIDAKQIWYDGEFYESDDEMRERILKMTETGEIEVLCNRFVLREGINLPHIAVGILACVFGSLKTYLQSVGRILRAAPGLSEVTIIDHGANYRRHGSPNADRKWELGMKGYKITGMRQEAMRERPELEPIICPACGMGRLSGPTCPACGHSCHKRSRQVVQINGELLPVEGPAYKPHYIKIKPDTGKKWRDMYYRAMSKKWNATFNQAEALFYVENHYYPPRDLPNMPMDSSDWFERVRDVPKERLRSAE
jgi:superfamily II DNA or RNA helicase